MPELTSWKMPDTGDDVGTFLLFHRKKLELLIERIVPTQIVMEAPILPPAKYDSVKRRVVQFTTLATTRKLQGLAGITEMVAVEKGIPICEVGGSTVKKELGGSGKADKADMMAVARKVGLAPKVHDEADAFGVWIVAVRYFAKKHSPYWDRKLYGVAARAPSML